MFLLASLALFPRLLLGFFISHWIWPSRRPSDLLIKLALALPLGAGISSLLSFMWIWGGLDLHWYAWTEAISVSVVGMVIIWHNRHEVQTTLQDLSIVLRKISLTWSLLLLLSILLFSAFFWGNSSDNPHGRWDAWSNWNVVARFVYRGGADWQGTFLRIYDHPDYPFLLTMTNSTTWELLQKDTTRGPIILAFIFGLSTIGLMFSLVGALRGQKQASFAAILLATQPIVAYHGMALYADLPEACYFLAAVGLFSLFLMRRDPPIAILAGLMAGLGAWTKNEGLSFIIICLILWAGLVLFSKNKTGFKEFVFGLALPSLVLILFKLFLAPGNDLLTTQRDLLTRITDLQRYDKILEYGVNMFWTFGSQPVSIAAALIIYSILVGKTKFSVEGSIITALAALGQLLVYFLIYLTTPHDLNWHLSTSLSRLYLHLFPLTLLAVFLWVKTPDELWTDVHQIRNP